jgi:sigma-B regulation protein RsbU (phosphoserine phosphatase)
MQPGTDNDSHQWIAGKRVLVVDQEGQELELLKSVLAQFGVLVETATDASEAVRILQREKTDLLISNLGIQDEDASILLGEIRAQALKGKAKIPAIALITHVGLVDPRSILSAGYDAYLPRSFEAETLLAMLSALSPRMDAINSAPAIESGSEIASIISETSPAGVRAGDLPTRVNPDPPAARGCGLARILIIDEDPEIHQLLSTRLKVRGFVVQNAFDRDSALRLLEDFAPDIAFLDATLPQFSFSDLLKVIRAQNWDMAVVLMMPRGTEQFAIEALRQGAADCLRKPFDREEFQTLLNRVISHLVLSRRIVTLQRQLDIEMSRAAEVQAQLLPAESPLLSDFDLAARCVPSKKVGGDFYDWIKLSPTRLTLTVGDVMGKGMSAALMMATVRAVIRGAALQNTAASTIQAAARAMDSDLERCGSFVTLFHAQLDLESGRLTYVDAGHGYVMLRRASGLLEELGPAGLPMGVFSDEIYQEGCTVLNPGDTLVVYSDGLLHALPELSRDRLSLAAQINFQESALELVSGITTRACAAGPLSDDLTVAVLHRRIHQKVTEAVIQDGEAVCA